MNPDSATCWLCKGKGSIPLNLHGDAFPLCPVCHGAGTIKVPGKNDFHELLVKMNALSREHNCPCQACASKGKTPVDRQDLSMEACVHLAGTDVDSFSKKDLARDEKPVKVAVIFDGQRWTSLATRPVEIAMIACLEQVDKNGPEMTAMSIQQVDPVADNATFREALQDKLTELTDNGQIDSTYLRRVAEFTQ